MQISQNGKINQLCVCVPSKLRVGVKTIKFVANMHRINLGGNI